VNARPEEPLSDRDLLELVVREIRELRAAVDKLADAPISAPAAPGQRRYDQTAEDIAARHGVKPAWVRKHAEALGGIRLGTGTRPRHRFDGPRTDERLAAMGVGLNVELVDRQSPHAPPRRRPRTRKTEVALLPIKGRMTPPR